MGGGPSRLNCTSQRSGRNPSSDERPYEPSGSHGNHTDAQTTQNAQGQAGDASRAAPGEGRPGRSASAATRRSSNPESSIFSPTRNSSQGTLEFPVPTQNGHLPSGSYNQATPSFLAQSQFSTDFSLSYVPSDDEDIPYIDRSRPSSSFFSYETGLPWLSQGQGHFSPSELSLGNMRPRANSSASCLTHKYTFNFDHCEDVQIGDKSVTNITMERRAQQLDDLTEISLSKEKRWTRNTVLFRKTHSREEALKTLKDNGAVVVVGRKGDGKTSIAKTILLQLKKELEERPDVDNSVILVEVEEPVDLIDLCSRNYEATFLVLVDDVFGKSAVDGIKLDKWQRKAEEAWEALMDSRIKLVMTIRKHVWNKAKPLLEDYDLFMNRIDLTSPEMSLGGEEKANILSAHLAHSKRVISEDLVREVSQTIPTPPGFPQCCSMFSTVNKLFAQGAQFFRKPSTYLKKLLEELHSSNPNLYMALALTLMFGGRFSTKNFSKVYLDSNPHVKETVEEVLECCSTEGKVTLGQLKSSFDTLLDVFFESNENETCFRFNHDSIEEAVAGHFGTKYPQVLIKCCRLRSLQQWICTSRKDQESYVVYVNSSFFSDLYNRLNVELLLGKADTVFTLPPARDEIFVNGWIKVLENSPSLVQELEERKSELLIQASKNGVRKFVEFVLSRSWTAPEAEVLAKAVKCAACAGHQCVLEILLYLNPPRTVVAEAFVEVLEVGHVSSVRSLLQYYPELLQKQFPDKLDSLQRNSKQLTKRQNSQRWKKCLHLASYHGCVDLVQHFLDSGMDPHSTDSHSRTALHHAAESGYSNVVELLLQVEGGLEIKDRFGRTALHYAAKEGHIDVVRQLVDAGASVNAVDKDGDTARCLAESKGYEAVAELLRS